jgi:hypothetical protein
MRKNTNSAHQLWLRMDEIGVGTWLLFGEGEAFGVRAICHKLRAAGMAPALGRQNLLEPWL